MSEKDGRLWMEPEIVDFVRALAALRPVCDFVTPAEDGMFVRVLYDVLRLGLEVEYADGWMPKAREGAKLVLVLSDGKKKPWWGLYVGWPDGYRATPKQIFFERVRYEDEAPLPDEKASP